MNEEKLPTPDLSNCFIVSPQEGIYIHPIKLLQFLTNRATLLAEYTATPGREPISTEALRGRRVEALILKDQIEKALKKWQPTAPI